jgi:hypothetical protein
LSEARNQLERILASDLFIRSARLSGLLRYVVEQTLKGQGSVLKEQVLRIELYSRVRRSTARPIRSSAWTPAAFVTSCGNITLSVLGIRF